MGGAISFGYNSGRFNLQFNGGWAAGANVDFNPHDSGASKMQALAIKVGVKTSAEVKAGPFVRGEAEVNEFFEADMCNNWHVKGAFKGVAGGRVPFTDFKVHAGGAVGPEIGGQGWHIDEAHFYAENEGASIGLGGMVFGGAIIGFSW